MGNEMGFDVANSWTYEIMHLDGNVEALTTGIRELKDFSRLECDGCNCEFHLYASFPELQIWAYLPADMNAQLTNILEIRLPSPLGDRLYGTPLLWRSSSGIGQFWRRQAATATGPT